MTEIAGGAAVNTAGEPGRVDTFFLGASVPTGAQSVVVTRTNNTTRMYASAATQTAGGDTEVTGIALLQNNGKYTEQSVDDGSPGVNSVRYAAGYSGGAGVLAAGAASTILNSIDFGAYTATTARETTAGQGARNVGFTYGTNDDRAAVHLAVRESPAAPTVATNAASALTATGATLNGTVSSNRAITTVTFDYGLTTGYGSTATAAQSQLAANAVNATVSADVTGLTCNTLYHFRVVATNSAGTTNGSDLTFTTTACVPTATTNAATSVTATTATLNGTVSSNGASTAVTFEYGLTAGYGSTGTATPSPVAAVSGSPNSTAVSLAVSSLTCNTLYHFRVVATNSVGTTNGSDLTFTTTACVPTATTDAATSVTATGATLNGTVSSNGAITTVTFDYGTTVAYGSSATATQSPLAANAVNAAVSADVTGLTCNTLYHFQVNGVNSAGTTNGGDLTFTTSACPTVVINTYYPGTASVAAGATSITLGVATGATAPIAIGDLLLIMQMQDATIDSTNTAAYGTVSAANAGLYEYAIAASAVPLGGGTLSLLPCGIINAYTNANYAAGSSGQKRFQVIRVPVYASYTINAITALAWNGSTGGVLAFDVTGALNLNTATVDVSGMGFRGGASRMLAGPGATGTKTDYVTLATVNNNASKGEGIAGTPTYVFTAPSTLTNTGVEGYPLGSHARGAPANAGGGGTDGSPTDNQENTGGGGGANAGVGGMGGIGWCSVFNASLPNYNCSNSGGVGGYAVTGLGATRLTLGGGGGGATSNNGTGTPAAGLASSGAAGGGSIMIRADSFTGSATFNANGSAANNTVGNDGSGGGGAGGTVMLLANSDMAGATINVNGGMGGTNLIPPLSSGPHGPGGGGGGGYAITSAATAACNNGGGINGVTYNNGVLFGAYGSTPGSAGLCATSLTAAQIPGTRLGAVSCSGHDHYAISYPLGNPGVTCEALAVRVTGHKIDHTDAVPSMGTQITLSTSPAADGWALRSGGGAFTAPNKYTFDGTETYAEFWLTETTPTTAPHIDIDVTDGSRTDIDGDTTEDVKAGFTDTAFKYYDCTGAVPGTCSEVSINNQIAGKPSSTAPNAQSLYLRAVKKNTTTSTCTGGLAGVQVVQFAYECNNPATCYGSNMLTINASGNSITIPRNDNTNVSISTGSYSAATGACPSTSVVCMNFTADGFAPFNLNYSDAGQVTLHARKTVTAGVGDPPSTAATIYGASNAFVRPFAFELTVPGNPKATAYNGTVFKAAGDNFDATVRGVVWQAADDDPSGTPAYDGLPNAGADLSDNAVTPSYAWTTDLLADATAGSYTPLPADGGVLGALAPSLATISQASFSNGSATYTPLTWSEVGSFTLKADATDYLGVSGLNMRGSVVVGRFYPHHFGISGTVRTRSDRPAGSGFTYMDEPMELTLTVKAYRYVASHSVNPDDDITLNYVGSFAKLDATTLCSGDVATCATGANGINWFNTGCTGSTQCMGLGAVQAGAGYSNRLAVDNTADFGSVAPISNWAAGIGTFTLNAIFGRRADGEIDGPHNALQFGGMPRDSDGVTLPGPAAADIAHRVNLDGTNERRLLFTTDVRYGRLQLSNAYGSELLPIRVPVRTEYCSASSGGNCSRWLTNSDDSLTPLAAANVAIGNCQGSLVSQCTGVGGTPNPGTVTSTFVSSTVVGGLSTMILARPGCPSPCPAGSFDLAFNLGTTVSDVSCNTPSPLTGTTAGNQPWLRFNWCIESPTDKPNNDPNARIKLGSPKAPYIYLRERY